MDVTIGVDLGGTKVLAARVAVDGVATHHVKRPTPTTGPDAVADAIAEAVLEVDPTPSLVGIGAPGPVADGVVLSAPNLAGFDRAVPLRDMVAARLPDATVMLGNDANVGTLGEVRFGAAVGGRDVLGCWLGTGIGGGLVLDGRMHVGAASSAAELGHVPVQFIDPLHCGCGRRGCAEAYAGRASLAHQVQEAIGDGVDTALPQIMVDKGKDRMTSGVWKAALKAGDPLATRLMDRAVLALGAVIAGVINLLEVDTVVFGGGLAEKLGQPHVDRIAEAARPNLMVPDATRRWVLADLGDDAGVIGAAAMIGAERRPREVLTGR